MSAAKIAAKFRVSLNGAPLWCGVTSTKPQANALPARYGSTQGAPKVDRPLWVALCRLTPPVERPLWMAPALQEKFDVLALVGSSLLSGLLMQSTLDCWP